MNEALNKEPLRRIHVLIFEKDFETLKEMAQVKGEVSSIIRRVINEHCLGFRRKKEDLFLMTEVEDDN
jgi:hypothetical protein